MSPPAPHCSGVDPLHCKLETRLRRMRKQGERGGAELRLALSYYSGISKLAGITIRGCDISVDEISHPWIEISLVSAWPLEGHKILQYLEGQREIAQAETIAGGCSFQAVQYPRGVRDVRHWDISLWLDHLRPWNIEGVL